MPKDLNPNKVKKHEVDEVFRALVTEHLRKNPKYLQLPQAQMDRIAKEAESIVAKARAKREKEEKKKK